jgi:hypothetical protein
VSFSCRIDDIWHILAVPLYFSKERPIVIRDDALIMVDDERTQLLPSEQADHEMGAVPRPRLLSTHERDREQRADRRGNCSGDAIVMKSGERQCPRH